MQVVGLDRKVTERCEVPRFRVPNVKVADLEMFTYFQMMVRKEF